MVEPLFVLLYQRLTLEQLIDLNNNFKNNYIHFFAVLDNIRVSR